MKLTSSDLEMFTAIGVPEHLVRDVGIRRVTHHEARDLCGIRYGSDHLEGLAIPYHRPDGGDEPVVSWRVRRDNPELETDGTPIAKYVSSPDRKHLYFSPGAYPHLADASLPVIIVEAEKSVLAITEARLRVNRTPWPLIIGLGGCWGWRGVTGKRTGANGARVDQKGPVADLDLVTWNDPDVIIIFDSNIATNTKVQAARRALTAELEKRGAAVRLVDLLVEQGVNGPDDYIGKYGPASFWALVDGAKPTSVEKNGSDNGKRESQATTIVNLALDTSELWHTPSGESHATISTNGHREHYPLNAVRLATTCPGCTTRTPREHPMRAHCRMRSTP